MQPRSSLAAVEASEVSDRLIYDRACRLARALPVSYAVIKSALVRLEYLGVSPAIADKMITTLGGAMGMTTPGMFEDFFALLDQFRRDPNGDVVRVEPDAGRLAAQAVEISEALSGAGVGPCPLPVGVRSLVDRLVGLELAITSLSTRLSTAENTRDAAQREATLQTQNAREAGAEGRKLVETVRNLAPMMRQRQAAHEREARRVYSIGDSDNARIGVARRYEVSAETFATCAKAIEQAIALADHFDALFGGPAK